MQILLGAELVALLACLFLVALLYTYRLTVAYILENTLGALPVIGGRAVNAINGALDDVEKQLRKWLSSMAHTLIDWLTQAAAVSGDFVDEIRKFAVDTATAFDHAIHTTVHDIIKAFLAPVWAKLTPLVAQVANLDDTLGRFRDRVTDVIVPRLDRELDRLGNGIDRLRTDTIPALRKELNQGIDAVGQKLDRVALPRIGAIEVELPGLRTGLRDVRETLSGLREWVVPVASVFTAAAVVSLLRHVLECRPKTERLCSTDPQYLDELLGLAILLPHLDEIRNIVRESAHFAHELADEFSDSLGR